MIADECHHIPAAAFEHAVKQIAARYWLGLTDVADATARGRCCLILTQRTAHLEALAAALRDQGHDLVTLRGGMTTTARKAALARLSNRQQPDHHQASTNLTDGTPADGLPADGLPADGTGRPPLLVIATGSYIGEGFDCPLLDTLFLTTPIAFKGRLVQYVGRVLRTHPGKTTAEVHDYHDPDTPILASSLTKRAPGYTSLGFPDPRNLLP